MPILPLTEGGELTFVFWAPRIADLDSFCGCPKVSPEDKKKITRYFNQYSKRGFRKQVNKQKFRHVEDSLYELKPTSQLRMIGFFQEKSFVIVLGLRKKQDELAPKDIKKAKDNKERYHAEVGA